MIVQPGHLCADVQGVSRGEGGEIYRWKIQFFNLHRKITPTMPRTPSANSYIPRIPTPEELSGSAHAIRRDIIMIPQYEAFNVVSAYLLYKIIFQPKQLVL